MRTLSSITIAILVLLHANHVHGGEPVVLHKVLPLPGVAGRFDHFAIDAKGQRLFLAALGNNTLEIFDVANGKHLHSIKGLSKPTGVAYLPEENLVCVANGNEGSLRVYHGENYTLLKNLKNLDDADNLRYDSKAKRLYLGYGDGALAVIDPGKWEVISHIKLPAHPESFQLDPNGANIYANLPDARQVAVLNRNTGKQVAEWPMKDFRANFPMALDSAGHRLFVGCRQPAQLVIFDTVAGKVVANISISGDTDDLFFDAKQKRLYLSCGEGFLDVFQNSGADQWTRIQKLPTSTGARTCYFSSDLGQLYLAVPERRHPQAELRIYQTEQTQ